MITETATSAPGFERAAPEHEGRAGDDAEAQRLLDRAVRQVPRGAAVADVAGRPVRRLAHRWRRVRVLLRLHRRGEQPVLPGALRRAPPRSSRRSHRRRATTSPRTWPTTPSTGCAPRRRWRRTSRSSCTSLPAPRTRRTTCRRSGRTSTPGSSPTAGTRSGNAILDRQKQLGVVPADAELTAAAGRDPGVGRDGRGAQAGAGTPDGGLRGVPRAHRLPRRPARSTRSRASGPWRTRSSTTSSATTGPRPRAPSTARSTRWRTSTASPRSRRRSSWRR